MSGICEYPLVTAADAIVIILALAELTIAIISVVLTSKFFFCSRPATQNIPQLRYQPLPQQQMAGNYYQSQAAQGYHVTTQPQVGYTTQPLPSATAEAPPTGQNPIN
ncbi:uncharacterized protein LOC119725169 [Patiria miniata]|uniref:Uncharacterized protein n=1 Tax=Patiria miniata TaxID=46514 RepID=A0A913ZKY0_PATMI|nr:uncharacterized protein LOC119725169 [Patiria miniata]